MNDLVIVFVGTLAGFFLGFTLSMPIIKRIVQIHRTPRCSIAASPIGEIVEVTGKATSELRSLRSPLTQTSCVLWRVEILEDQSTGEGASWKTIINETSVHPFDLKDRTGKISVYPTGAEFLLHDDLVKESGFFSTFKPAIKEAVEKFGIPTTGPWSKPLQVYEQVIKSGETVCVLGKAKENNHQRVISSTKDGSPFLISDRSQRALLLTLYWRVASRALLFVPLGFLVAVVISHYK